MKTSNEADEKFKKAAIKLIPYELEDARRWPERLPVMLTLPLVHLYYVLEDEVEFLIHKSLIDNSPTSVKREPAHRCGLW